MGRAALGRCVDGAGRGGSRRNRGPAEATAEERAPRRPSRSWAATVPPGHQRMRGCAWRRRSSATLAGIHRSTLPLWPPSGTGCLPMSWPPSALPGATSRARGQPEGDRRQALRVAGVLLPRVFHAAGGRDRSARRPLSTTHGCLCELHRRGRQRRHVQRLRRDRLGRGDRAGKSPSTPPNFEQGVLAAVAEAAGGSTRPSRTCSDRPTSSLTGTTVASQHPDHPHRREDRAAHDSRPRGRGHHRLHRPQGRGLSEGDRRVAGSRRPNRSCPARASWDPRWWTAQVRSSHHYGSSGWRSRPPGCGGGRGGDRDQLPLVVPQPSARAPAARLAHGWERQWPGGLVRDRLQRPRSVIREYERTATTVLNAPPTPARTATSSGWAIGPRGAPWSDLGDALGGRRVVAGRGARERGVTLLSSGPAGGMLGARELARRLELDRHRDGRGRHELRHRDDRRRRAGTRTCRSSRKYPWLCRSSTSHRSAPAGQHRLDRAGDRCAEGRTSERRRLARPAC